jgi:cytochrome c oxidase assembly protein subunit 15
MHARFPITPERFATITKVALFMLVLIVFTGAAVRLTGSGLGCPTWPKCTETSVHSSLTTHGVIEFGNRVLTFFVSAGVIAAALGAYWVRPERRDLRYLALSLPFGVMVQAVIGGISVKAGLAPGWVMAHYVVSMLLLVWAFDLWWRSARSPEEVQAERADRAMVLTIRVLMGLAVVAIVLGTVSTAAGPHAGSSGTGEFVGRLDFLGDDTLSQVIHIHGYIVTALGLGTLAAWWRSRKTDNRELTQTFMLTLGLLATQGLIGILQYQLELPSEMVWVHVALATLTWVGYVHLRAAAGPLPARAKQPTAAAATSN